MHKVYYFLLLTLFACVGCEWQFTSSRDDGRMAVERYDRVQSLYLTTGDFSALQQMNTVYPMQTRTLIEDVLRIGKVDDQQINTKFLRFFQDSTLQSLIAEAEQQYANMDDINQQLTTAFTNLKERIPDIEVPAVYAQIGALDQSIIVGNNAIGICLDKYLGATYPLYLKPAYGYKKEQLAMMERRFIVPDCVSFYLLSLYPMAVGRELTQVERDKHIGKIQWVVNQVMGERVFASPYVQMASRYMRHHPEASFDDLLRHDVYADFR